MLRLFLFLYRKTRFLKTLVLKYTSLYSTISYRVFTILINNNIIKRQKYRVKEQRYRVKKQKY